jgi:hypothetical protein
MFLQNDPWFHIRDVVDDFNRNMEERLTPGKFLVVDEIMSMWLGKDGKYAVEGITRYASRHQDHEEA